MFAVINCKQKNWSKKVKIVCSQLVKQKEDNVITLEGTGTTMFLFFSVPSNVITLPFFCSQLLSANKQF